MTVSQPWVANGTVALPEQGLGSVLPVAEQAGQANTGAASVPGVQVGVSVDATLVPGDELVHFKARGKTWVEVLDGKGLVVLRRILADGEQTGAGGQPPLAVVVGSADVTEVWVRGKVFEIKSISQGNVARFEVK